jgi:AAA15 family ATPase/GTPase
MIKAIELENFKAFGKRATIQFAPITLIFGENSSGKSSILQSLNVLKQTRESREVGALLLPRTDHGFVDLGSYQELIFDHDHSRKLRIKVTFDVDNRLIPQFLNKIFMKNKLPNIISLELVFRSVINIAF